MADELRQGENVTFVRQGGIPVKVVRYGGTFVRLLPYGGTLVTAVRSLVRGGVFPRSPDSPSWDCDRCDMSYACDEVTWVRERKRTSAALGALVALQNGEFTAAAGGEDADA